ncbi:EAL domain-containing protein [Noviherbaspirillum sp. UKPF54]|uniref:EAL domain-containing protein n=1 Tax=Noviherbaspirillum sp. UKPF54 TaxID=2601898 RepID=UPI0011B1C318|nr:EAL domain-containing protein [Noviherbaspirillum sp. UKPF54]QDZ28591.1 EAL domain-containing protein [Noviherbaspirillum sp. UKPF54]
MKPDLPRSILYLEDNAVDADLARRALARQMPETAMDLAPTLAAALERLAAHPHRYDMVLSDLRLPDGSGMDLLGHIRERKLPIAVVILTGSGDQAAAIAALKAGADDYVVKRDDYCRRLIHTLPAALARFRRESARKAGPLRVLYAEHNIFDIDLCRRHFSAHAPHIRLQVVGNGTEVLDCLPENSVDAPPYDVVLLDYQLPGINALEIAKILRDERGFDLPVVLLTGQGSEEVVAEALRLGIADFVGKHKGYLIELPAILEHAHRQAQLVREQQALRMASTRLHHLLEANPTILYALRKDGDSFVPNWVSENIARVYGYSPDECLNAGWWLAHLHPEDRERVLHGWKRLLADGALVQEYRFYDKAGEVRWVRDDMRVLPDASGNVSEVVGSWNDITLRRQSDERLRLHAAAMDSTRDGILITDLEGRILACNPAFTKITGYREPDILGLGANILQLERQDARFFQTLRDSVSRTGQWQGEIWSRRKDGEINPQWLTVTAVYDGLGNATHYVAVMTDLTMLKRSEQRLDRLAHYDSLTDLPNRVLLHSLLQHAIERAMRHEQQVGALLLNLDQFKIINDSLGRASGDELLLSVTSRLKAGLRADDVLGRLGGDEFSVVLEALQEPLDAEILARNLLGVFDAPFVLSDGHEVCLRASIGIGVFPQDGATAQDLLHHADAAMHRAKEDGGNQFAFYTRDLSARALGRLEMAAGLQRALAQREFALHYQPKVDLASGRISGAEALLRWLRPGHGMISPLQFIPLAEKGGQIVAIGAWVIDEACRQIRAWSDTGLSDINVAVNVSARQFTGQDLETVVTAALERHRIAPQCLTLELTESMLMEEPEKAIQRLARLKRLGVLLSLDDFGTGYSSLAYLSRFPMDQLKIDRSFVTGIDSDTRAANIANSIIDLAHCMQLKVVAEGVETASQLAYLAKNRCDEIQGFYFSKPVPADEFASQVRQGKRLADKDGAD